MIVIVHNKSRKEDLKQKFLSSIIFPIAERIHIGRYLVEVYN